MNHRNDLIIMLNPKKYIINTSQPFPIRRNLHLFQRHLKLRKWLSFPPLTNTINPHHKQQIRQRMPNKINQITLVLIDEALSDFQKQVANA